MIQINAQLRLRMIDKTEYYKAFPWYQDEEIQYFVNGVKEPYDMDSIIGMFKFIQNHGELYYIEVLEGLEWIAIGDVSLLSKTNDDLPITIGNKNYWRKGIGTAVLLTMIEKARTQGRKKLEVEIYDYNENSIKLYQKVGFRKKEKTEYSKRYYLSLGKKSHK